MKRKILYIINPVSGTSRKETILQQIEKKTAAEKIPFEIFSSVASGDYSFLRDHIREKNFTDVVIAGGDGTVSLVVGSLMNEPVNFGIIPCGSGNGLALAAGISRNPAKALDIIFNNQASAVDGFYINKRFACMLAGMGLDAEVAHAFADEPRRGLITYIRLSIQKFFSMTPYQFNIESDGMSVNTEAFFICIANSNQFGNNFTIAPKASLSDGLLDIVIVTRQNKMSLLLQTLKQVAGWNFPEDASLVKKDKGVIYFQVKKLVIENLSGAPLHIDGEPSGTMDKLEIEVREKCYRLIHSE